MVSTGHAGRQKRLQFSASHVVIHAPALVLRLFEAFSRPVNHTQPLTLLSISQVDPPPVYSRACLLP